MLEGGPRGGPFSLPPWPEHEHEPGQLLSLASEGERAIGSPLLQTSTLPLSDGDGNFDNA